MSYSEQSITISVITPVLNNAQFIGQCIENVISQKCYSCEHIIADGGSTDGTVKIIATYAQRYPHIRWFSERDRGQSDAINKALKLANGRVVSILNADDYYEPNVLNFVKEKFSQHTGDPFFLVGKCRVVGEENSFISINDPVGLTLTRLLSHRCQHPCNPSAYFYDKSLHEKVGYYDVEDHYSMDLDFLCRVLLDYEITYSPKVLGNFRERQEAKTQQSKLSGQHFPRKRRVLRKAWNSLPFHKKMQVLSMRLSDYCYKAVESIRNVM